MDGGCRTTAVTYSACRLSVTGVYEEDVATGGRYEVWCVPSMHGEYQACMGRCGAYFACRLAVTGVYAWLCGSSVR